MADNAQTQYYNQQAASLAAQVANQAAQLEFQRMRFTQLELPQFQEMTALEKEKLAFQKATEVWNDAFRESSLTGSYQGVPITQYLLQAAELTGQFYQPGTLTPEQQLQYNTVRNRIDRVQADLQATPINTARHDQLENELAGLQAELSPLTQILQGTNKAPVQTLQAQQQAFLQALQAGQLTGQYQGAPTLEAQQQQFAQAMQLAGLTGFIPGTISTGGLGGTGGTGGVGGVGGTTGTGGQMTLPMIQLLSEITGQYNGSPTLAAQLGLGHLGVEQGQLGVAQGQLDLARLIQTAQESGYLNGAPTLAREQMDSSQANQLLALAAQLRGPENAFQFQKVIGQTPGGLTDMLSAMAGRYNLPSFAGPGAAPQPVNLQNFVADVQNTAGNTVPTFTPPASQQQAMPAYQFHPPGAQAPTAQWNYQPTADGGSMVYPPGITAPQQAGQVSSATPLTSGSLAQIGAQTLAQQPYQLPAPNQLNAANYNELPQYSKDLLWAAFENQGYDKGAAQDIYKASLPNSGGPTAGHIAGVI